MILIIMLVMLMITKGFILNVWNRLTTDQLIELEMKHKIDSFEGFLKLFKGFY